MLKQIDEAIGGIVAELVDRKEITGKLAEITRLLAPPGLAARQLVIVGLGNGDQFGQGCSRPRCRRGAKLLAAKPQQTVVFGFES